MTRSQTSGISNQTLSFRTLDPDDEFLALPNVIATPHIVGSTYGVTSGPARQVADNILWFVAGEPLVNVANLG